LWGEKYFGSLSIHSLKCEGSSHSFQCKGSLQNTLQIFSLGFSKTSPKVLFDESPNLSNAIYINFLIKAEVYVISSRLRKIKRDSGVLAINKELMTLKAFSFQINFRHFFEKISEKKFKPIMEKFHNL
jgi:hypothetical protein